MVIPDFRNFVGTGVDHLRHSAKGSTWEDHKYIKRDDGVYYYPDSYTGGRHLPSNEVGPGVSRGNGIGVGVGGAKPTSASVGSGSGGAKPKGASVGEGTGVAKPADNSNTENEADKELSDEDVEKLAIEVIRGNYGNGEERKIRLGKNYSLVQQKVNELLRKTYSISSSSIFSTKVSQASGNAKKKVEEIAKKVGATAVSTSSKTKTDAKKQSPTKTSNVHSGVDLSKIQSVYKKKKK